MCNVKSKGSDFQNWLLISHDVVLPAQCACTTLVFWVFNLFSEVLELDLLVAWWCSYPYLVFWNRACIIVMDWVPKMCFENSGQKTNDHMTKICQKWRKAFFKLPLKEYFQLISENPIPSTWYSITNILCMRPCPMTYIYLKLVTTQTV